METEKQELLEFSKRWDEAMVSNDADEIAKFMSDDWKLSAQMELLPNRPSYNLLVQEY